MRPYLEGYKFQVITDHLSLKWLNSIDNPTGRLARWALELQQHQFDIRYRKGKQNVVADALSRQPIAEVNLVQARQSNICSWYEGILEAVRKNPEKFSEYAIVNNLLYRHFAREINDEDSTPWKLCVPIYQRQQVLTETHDSTTGGHLGIRKTLNKVSSRYYWPGMARDVGQYVRQCTICQQYKVSQQQPAGKMLTRIQNEPWSLICADFIGPLPRTKHGNTMLLVLFDNFSKWVELVPLRKATGEGIVKALRERIIARYGVPKTLISDNGAQFTSHILKNYLKEIGVQQQFTAPYSPQENPTERVNRTIKTIIAQFSGEGHNKWDKSLPEIMLAINTSESESTGYTPAFLTQGRSPRLPKALYDEVTVGSGARCLGPEERASELKEIFKIVRRNLAKASQKQKRHYDLRRRSWKPEIGDNVLVRQHPLSKAVDNFAAKLAPKYKGPYIVVGFISPVIVEIRDVETREKRTAHLSELKLYHPSNQLFSLTLHRSHKHILRTRDEQMETAEQKFERTRKKFRQNMKQEQEKRRHTIFLESDEPPSTSKERTNKKKRQRAPKAKHQGPPKNYGPEVDNSTATRAHYFRMATTTPSRPNSHETGHHETCYHEPATSQIWSDHVDGVDEEGETVPPPPPLTFTREVPERAASEASETMSPIFDEDCFVVDDLPISLEDLEDPLILEFARTFCGASDSTIDIQTPRDPSPPSSFSSLDWENESFRPPTPPRRKAFCTWDIEDRQFQYLGMQCYERNWRARIIVPKAKPASPLTLPECSFTPQNVYRVVEPTPVSPIYRNRSQNRAIPTTPGRGWLQFQDTSAEAQKNGEDDPIPSTRVTHVPLSQPNESPIPSPPSWPTSATDELLVVNQLSTELQQGINESPVPSPPPLHINASRDALLEFEQLPIELQNVIATKKAKHHGERIRFLREVNGMKYRVTILRNGTVRVTTADGRN